MNSISKATRSKQKKIKELIMQHISVVNAIQKKKPTWRIVYTYIEGTSHRGIYFDGEGLQIKGSPILFLETVKELKPLFKIKCYFIERDKQFLFELRHNVYEQKLEDVAQIEYICGEYEDEIPKILKDGKKLYGLIYIDPNGAFADDELEKICCMENIAIMDIIINCNSTAIKRVRCSEKVDEKYKDDLKMRISKISKSIWYISPPHVSNDPWGWCFLYGINSQCFKPTGMFSIDSPEGKYWMDKANYTKEEYKQKQQEKLF